LLDRRDEQIDRAVARLEIAGGEKQHVPCGGLSDDHGYLPIRCCADLVRLIVAMEGVERHRETLPARFPFRSWSDRSVGDLAQRTMSSTETRTDPIGELAAHGAVGVVHADEAHDLPGRCYIGGAHRNGTLRSEEGLATRAPPPVLWP